MQLLRQCLGERITSRHSYVNRCSLTQNFTNRNVFLCWYLKEILCQQIGDLSITEGENLYRNQRNGIWNSWVYYGEGFRKSTPLKRASPRKSTHNCHWCSLTLDKVEPYSLGLYKKHQPPHFLQSWKIVRYLLPVRCHDSEYHYLS